MMNMTRRFGELREWRPIFPVLRVVLLLLIGFGTSASLSFGQRSNYPPHWIDFRSGHSSGAGHSGHKLPRSLPNESFHDVVGGGATSSRSELGRLERASVVQAGGASHTRSVQAPRISVLDANSHSAPINFSHQQQRNSTVAQARSTPAPHRSKMH